MSQHGMNCSGEQNTPSGYSMQFSAHALYSHEENPCTNTLPLLLN